MWTTFNSYVKTSPSLHQYTEYTAFMLLTQKTKTDLKIFQIEIFEYYVFKNISHGIFGNQRNILNLSILHSPG